MQMHWSICHQMQIQLNHIKHVKLAKFLYHTLSRKSKQTESISNEPLEWKMKKNCEKRKYSKKRRQTSIERREAVAIEAASSGYAFCYQNVFFFQKSNDATLSIHLKRDECQWDGLDSFWANIWWINSSDNLFSNGTFEPKKVFSFTFSLSISHLKSVGDFNSTIQFRNHCY